MLAMSITSPVPNHQPGGGRARGPCCTPSSQLLPSGGGDRHDEPHGPVDEVQDAGGQSAAARLDPRSAPSLGCTQLHRCPGADPFVACIVLVRKSPTVEGSFPPLVVC